MMILFPLTFLSNAFVPVTRCRRGWPTFVKINPVSHLVSATRDLANHGMISGEVGWTLLAGLVVIAIFAPLSVRSYRRHILAAPGSAGQPLRQPPGLRQQVRRLAVRVLAWSSASRPGAASSAAGEIRSHIIVGIVRLWPNRSASASSRTASCAGRRPAQQPPGPEGEQQQPRGRVVRAAGPRRRAPGARSRGRTVQRPPVRHVVARRVAGRARPAPSTRRTGPRAPAPSRDSRELYLAHPGRALAVDAQAGGVVAGGERQLGVADLAQRAPAERGPVSVDAVHPAEFLLRVREPAVSDRAQREQRAELDLVVAGAEPLASPAARPWRARPRRRGRRRAWSAGPAWSAASPRTRGRPRPAQRERALGRRDRAGRIAGVLAQVAEPLAGGERGAPVLAAASCSSRAMTRRRRPGRTRASPASSPDMHARRHESGLSRSRTSRSRSNARRAPVISALANVIITAAQAVVDQVGRRLPVAQRVGDRIGQ